MGRSLASENHRRPRIRSVVDQVYDALLERVLTPDIPHGTRLRQGVLAEEMGLSRTPLREFDLGDMRHAWTARLTPRAGRRGHCGRFRGQPRVPSCARRRLALPHSTRFAERLWVSRIGPWIYSAQAADAPGDGRVGQ